MSGGRRPTRLPKGHPNYNKQLGAIRQYYLRRNSRNNPTSNEPAPDYNDLDEVPLTDAEINQAFEQLELDNANERLEATGAGLSWQQWDLFYGGDDRVQHTNAPTDTGQASTSTATGSNSKKRERQPGIDTHFEKKEKKPRSQRDKSKTGESSQAMGEPMDQEPVRPAQLGAGGGAGGGGAPGGSGGNNIEEEMKFGQPCGTRNHHYKRSFLVNINNGKTQIKLTRTAAAVGKQTQVVWNEGWQIIPWADIRAYLTPTDYFELCVMNRKWRIKTMSVTMEGLIPFQVDLSGATNSTTATFNNRINVHVYTDDGELLPDLGDIDTQAHNELFTVPWGEGSTGLLKSPDFTFLGADQPSAFRYYTDNAFATGNPQKYFSLYNTGRVKSVYPGQKFHKSWVNGNTNWHGRSPNDLFAAAYDLSQLTAADIDRKANELCQQSFRAGPTGHEILGLKNTPFNPGAQAADVTGKSMYLDTGLPLKYQGLPYILCRVEPYPNLGAGGGLIDIYAQAHLHYEMTVESMPLEKPTTYVPFITGGAVTQGTAQGFQQLLYKDTSLGITDNKVHRIAGTRDGDAVYT